MHPCIVRIQTGHLLIAIKPGGLSTQPAETRLLSDIIAYSKE